MRFVIAITALILAACTSSGVNQEQACLTAYEGTEAEFANASRTGSTLSDLCSCYSTEVAKLDANARTKISDVMLEIANLRETTDMNLGQLDKHLARLGSSPHRDSILNKSTLQQYDSFMNDVLQLTEAGGACRTIEKSKLHMMCVDLMSDDAEQQEWLLEHDTLQLEFCGCYSKITDGRTQSFRDHQAKFITEVLET